MKIVIVGAGGHGQVVADILLSMAKAGINKGEVIGFVDDDPTLHNMTPLNLPVLGTVKDCARIPHDALIMGIGHNATRAALFEKLKKQGEQFVSAIHPTAILGSQVKIGQGSVICAGVVVNTGTVVGQNVILNTGCTVDHHNHLGQHVHIGPGAHLGGDVSIGKGTLVGIGAVVTPQSRVGDFSQVGAGAVVIDSVPSHTTVAGVPARALQQRSRP